MAVVDVVTPFALHAGDCKLAYYGRGQYVMSDADAHNQWIRAHFRNGVAEPDGTPLSKPGPKVVVKIPGQPPDVEW